MNQEHVFPTDPMNEPNSPEALKRLEEIERRLKRVRPRPPQLDATALERLAHDAMADTASDRPSAAAIRREPRGRGRRLWRRVAVVAGSWACGASVGAIIMFVLMSPTAPRADSTPETVGIEKEPPTSATRSQNMTGDAPRQVGRRDGSFAAENVDTPEWDAAVLALISDSFGSGISAYWSDGPTLRAGMHLINSAKDSRSVEAVTDAARKPRGDNERRRGEMQQGSKPYPDPAPPITREQLMRDLLGKQPGLVL